MKAGGAGWAVAAGLALAAALLGWRIAASPSDRHPDSERYTARQAGVALIDGFTSQAAVADVEARLQARGEAPVRRRLARPPSASYPPQALDTLSVADHALLDTRGRLTLEFFNDRLYEIGFEPVDSEAARRALKRAYPELRRDRNGRAERIVGDLRLAANLDLAVSPVGQSLQTRPYVLWQDRRLIAERDDWDRRFGAIPVPAAP